MTASGVVWTPPRDASKRRVARRGLVLLLARSLWLAVVAALCGCVGAPGASGPPAIISKPPVYSADDAVTVMRMVAEIVPRYYRAPRTIEPTMGMIGFIECRLERDAHCPGDDRELHALLVELAEMRPVSRDSVVLCHHGGDCPEGASMNHLEVGTVVMFRDSAHVHVKSLKRWMPGQAKNQELDRFRFRRLEGEWRFVEREREIVS